MGLRFDNDKQRFIDTQTNLVMSPSRVMSQLNQTIEDGFKKLDNLGEALANDEINLESFADQMADTIKNMHLAEALKVKNGVTGLTINNLKSISGVIKDEFLTGVSFDGESKFGIIHLVDDIATSKVSPALLKRRLLLYGENARKSAIATQFSDAEDDEEITECLNILNKVKTQHHPICTEATAKGWITLKEMRDYGNPLRHPLCHCNLIYR